MLVAVAPRAPEDALAPVLLHARRRRQDVPQAGGQHDLPRALDARRAVEVRRRHVEQRVVVQRLDAGHGAVDAVCCLIVRNLLARRIAIVRGRDTCGFLLGCLEFAELVIETYRRNR